MPTQPTNPVTRPAGPPAPTATYADAYARLARLAEKLKGNGVATASIDSLVDDVRAARAAHAQCRERLAAIRAEIDAEIAAAEAADALPDAGAPRT